MSHPEPPPTKADRPEPPIVAGSREQLLHLLAEASEIEHTLMCCYLYATFSLKRAGEAGLSADEGAAVERWRATILDVAIEEMGHLLIVANLTIALGGRPHFGRPNFPISPGYFPSGVVVRLAGFSRATLEHFIFLERPQGDARADHERFVQDDYRREQRIEGLMPGSQDYETIGHLYEAVRWNLDRLAARIGEERLFVGPASQQLAAPAITMTGVDAITDLVSAHAAIDMVIDQGEGSRADREHSHFRSFTAIADEFDRLAQRPGFAPAWPVADNPVMRRPVDPKDRVYLDDVAAARVVDFGNASYGLLLRLLVQCFGRTGRDVLAEQKRLLDAAFTLMHVVGRTGDALARLPASPRAQGLHAGMSFTMLRGVEPLVGGSAEARLLHEQLSRFEAGAARLPKLAIDGAALRQAVLAFEAE